MSKRKIFCIIFFALSSISNLVSAEDLTVNSNTTWVSGEYTYDNVTITNSATLVFDGAVTLNATSLTIDSGSSISADGKGYLAGEGPGAGITTYVGGGGGGYGGRGGDGSSQWGGVGGVAYGSAIAPVDLGSGGGNRGGSGGGAIRLNINNTLLVNGNITANGSNGGVGTEGGGSGGSVYVTTRILGGSGLFSANGGNGGEYYGGGGGAGGRIAIYYNLSTFTKENAIARGGRGGSVYYRGKDGEDGTVGFFDTLNNDFYAGHSFRFQGNDSPFNFNRVILNNSEVTTQGNISLKANELILENNSNLVLDSASTIIIDKNLNLNTNSSLTLSGEETLTVNDVTISNNSIITHLPQGRIHLNITNLTIDTSSSISADRMGYDAGSGVGAGSIAYYSGGGGGYGGRGGDGYYAGALGGIYYGSAIVPVDLGSGGGGVNGGAGGGVIRLIVSDTLINNGSITTNGQDGGVSWGGGSGGSIYVTTKTLEGSGSFNVNGGTGGIYGGGGGAGGRIAIYYNLSTFAKENAIARGGTRSPYPLTHPYLNAKNGENGTVIIQGPSLDTSLTFFNLIEKSSTTSILLEDLLSQKTTLTNATVTGDLRGTLDFKNFEIVKIETGSFSGKGFSKGEFTANLEGKSYNGTWKGVNYFVTSENKIYLKGEISGDISGISEGFLAESNPGSGVYDKYQATWKLNRIGTDAVSATINLEGIFSYQSSYTFTSELYLYQANMEGSAYGYYTGPLSAVITHLRLTSENEYQDNGFSIISHNSNLGSGEGWAYNQLASPARIEFNGLFKEPILGKLSAFLGETKSPKTLYGTIERLDLGVVPAPELSVKVWGPQRVSPGQTINYIIEYRNDGLKSADKVFVSCYLDTLVKYISASSGVSYNPYAHRLGWKVGTLLPKTTGYLTFQVEVVWGLPIGYPLEQNAFIINIEPHSTIRGKLITGIGTNSSKSDEIEVLGGIAETFDLEIVWTYDKTDNIITGPLEVLANAKGIPTSKNGLEDPLLSQLSGHQEIVIAHSGGTRTAVTLAKEGKIWGDILYLVSPAKISQDELRIIRDLTAEGKGFKEIVLYTEDDMIPNFYKVSVNFEDYTIQVKPTEGGQVLDLPEVQGKDGVDVWKAFLDYYSNLAKQIIGLEPVSITIYSNIPGNKFEIEWEDGTIEIFYLQKETITGQDFQDEENIKIVPLYEGFPHGRAQLESLAEFYKLYGRMPGKEDLELFKQLLKKYLSKAKSLATPARDPNEKLVYPEGDIRPGDRLDYTINYENEGEGIAYGVYITDTLDRDLDDSTLIINNNGTYDSNTRTITWFIGEVGSHQKGSVTFSINAKPDLPDGTEIINFATVYFPSVPEVTRTNGTVNRIPSPVLDTTPPETTLSIFPIPNQAGWNNTDVTITLTAEDASGVKEIHYTLTGAETRENIVSGNTTQIVISTEGMTSITYWAIDNAGNIESAKTLDIKIDKTLPILTGTVSPGPNFYGWNNTDVTVSFIAYDNLSGIASVTEPITITTESANQYIRGEAIDIADNHATTSITINIDKTPPQVNITANPNLLWSPNHKMVNVSIGGSSYDSLSGIASTTFKVTDEYGTVEPSISNFNTIIQLEAWRNGNDLDGRAYTISVTTKDKADNQSFGSTTVLCPHDQRKK